MTMKPLERLAIWVKPEHVRAHSFDLDAKANWRSTFVKLVAEATAPGAPGLNVALEDGRTALEILYDNPDLGTGVRDLLRFASDIMLEAGANPLAFDGMAIRAAGRQQTSIAAGVIAFLARKESDTPLRDEQGGNLEHVFAEHEPQTLVFLRGMNEIKKQWNTSWRSMQRDSDGATPAHLIWREDGLISEWKASSQVQAISLFFVFWNALDGYSSLDLMIPDHAGVTVAQLMHDAIYTHGLPIPEGRKDILAEMEDALLHTNTRAARGAMSKVGRL